MPHAIRLLVVLVAVAPTALAQDDADFVIGNKRYAEKDYLGAYAKWRVAADRGHAGAANNIGHLLRAGLGVQRDYPAALRWFHKAADRGDPTAMHNIGLMYERGDGVQVNKTEALKWFRKADAKKFKGAKRSIERLTAKPKPKPLPTPKLDTTRRRSSGPMLGEIRAVGFNFAPRGWAKCEGQLLAIASNTALFSILGTTYGGDGRTTFGLPDLRGRSPVHTGKRGDQTIRIGQRWGGQRGQQAGTKGSVTLSGVAYTYVIALQGSYPSRSAAATSSHYNGEIVMFAGTFPPNGWPACDGQELRTTDFANLYRAVGKTYGGTTSTFRAPDLRGRVTVHTGSAKFLNRLGKETPIAPARGISQGPMTPRYLGIRHHVVSTGVAPGLPIEDPMIGEIRLFATELTPKGFAPCDGTTISIAKNSALYSLLGMMYGGDGRKEFKLPDLRGFWTVGAGTPPGGTRIRIGQRITITSKLGTTANSSLRPAPAARVRALICTKGVFPSRN
ncbi:MAG: tail fiber protein [Planctomycetota bacterium]